MNTSSKSSKTSLDPDSASFIIVVDDEAFSRRFFETILEEEGHQCLSVGSAKELYDYLENGPIPELLILDVRLPDGDGLKILEWIRGQDISVPVIIITAYGSISDAVRAMKTGAFDFFTKPFEDTNKIKISIKNALDHGRLSKEVHILRTRIHSQSVFRNLIGKSHQMQRVYEMVEKVAKVPNNILIEGESGTGKDLVARAIHDLSGQRENAFIPVNCAALSESLLESALFGYEKGAFTGAEKTTAGFFEEAHQGTLFLDEIGEASPAVQVKILRAVEEGTIYRLGRPKPISINVHLIFATNHNLAKEVTEGRFRKDLYYRINNIKITLPPLRERKEDIPLLVNHFIEEYSREAGISKKVFEDAALHYLIDRNWPGNVRQLKNFIEKVMALHSREVVTVHDIVKYFEEVPPQESLDLLDMEYDQARKTFEKRYFEKLILTSEGNLTLAAASSGIHLATIYRKIRDLGINYK